MQSYRPPGAAKQQLWSPAWVALGGNVGDVPRAFRSAVAQLHSGHTEVLAVSALYVTEPLPRPGVPTHRHRDSALPYFYNAACSLRTRLGPHQLLRCLQALERRAGRERRELWGPRTLDLDLLAYATVTLRHRALTLPHPSWAERAFVLQPLADLHVMRLPPQQLSCAVLLARAEVTGKASILSRQLSWIVD